MLKIVEIPLEKIVEALNNSYFKYEEQLLSVNYDHKKVIRQRN